MLGWKLIINYLIRYIKNPFEESLSQGQTLLVWFILKLSPAKALKDNQTAVGTWFWFAKENLLFRTKIKNVADQYPVDMPRVVSNISLDVFEYSRNLK